MFVLSTSHLLCIDKIGLIVVYLFMFTNKKTGQNYSVLSASTSAIAFSALLIDSTPVTPGIMKAPLSYISGVHEPSHDTAIPGNLDVCVVFQCFFTPGGSAVFSLPARTIFGADIAVIHSCFFLFVVFATYFEKRIVFLKPTHVCAFLRESCLSSKKPKIFRSFF